MSLTIYIKNNDTDMKCTYDEWNIFRQSIMKSFIKLLEEKIILNKYKSKETQNDINDFISHYYETINDDNIIFTKAILSKIKNEKMLLQLVKPILQIVGIGSLKV